MSAKHKIQTEAVNIPISIKEPRSNRNEAMLHAAVVPSEEGVPVRGVVAMGLGSEGRRLPLHAAELAAARGLKDVLFVPALPYWLATPTDKGLTNLGVQGMRQVADFVRDMHGKDAKLHTIGESQGAGAVLESAIEDPEALDGALVIVHGLGSVALSKLQFMTRMGRSGMQRDQLHTAAPAVVAHSMQHVFGDAIRRGDERGAQLRYALGYDLPQRAQDLHAAQPDRPFYVVAGSKDILYPPEEQYASLAAHGLEHTLRVIEGASHSTLASPAGARQAELAARQWEQDVLPKYEPPHAA